MNYREYQKLKAEAQAEYHRKLEAIETVWKLSGGETPNANNGSKPNENGLVRGSLQEVVRQAYQQIPNQFTVRDVYNHALIVAPHLKDALKDRMPSISGTLKRMAEEKELILVEAGSGKRASIYRKPG